MRFVPLEDEKQKADSVPYFEDVRAGSVRGYTTSRSRDELVADIMSVVKRLGGRKPKVVDGKFIIGNQERRGFQLRFEIMGNDGVINIAALPIRSETEFKINQASCHALFALHQMLLAQAEAKIMTPGIEPLIQYVLMPDSGDTFGEAVAKQLEMRALPQAVFNKPGN